METQFFDLKVWSEARWKKNGSDVREQNFARKHAHLGWGESGARFPLPHWNVAPFASSSLSLSLSLYWALSPPSPCAICPLPGGRWRRGRGESVHEGIHREEEAGDGITVNCYFCKQNDFVLLTGENTTGAGNVDSELLDRKLVDEIQRGSNSNYSRCCSYICSS